METLTESVYECTLAVEAHMICDLLARAGISARVEGEFLAGGVGELPMGSSIKVRVEPARAAEAREVIDEWQRHQPPSDPTPAPARSGWLLPLWFVGGAIIGGLLMTAALRTPVTQDSVDLDGDGRIDETYHYAGDYLDRIEYDRNGDRQVDGRWIHDRHGMPERWEGDDDFDGFFEWRGESNRGWVVRNVKDADDDGTPERVDHFQWGVMTRSDLYQGERVAVRQTYDNMRLVAREYDADGDGVFERRVEFDAIGEPVAAAPAVER